MPFPHAQLGNNQFTGGLPAGWAACGVGRCPAGAARYNNQLVPRPGCRVQSRACFMHSAALEPTNCCLSLQGNLSDLGLQQNQLAGPAFPPAWLAPNSTLNLRRLQLADNPALEGTLPHALDWPRLEVV